MAPHACIVAQLRHRYVFRPRLACLYIASIVVSFCFLQLEHSVVTLVFISGFCIVVIVSVGDSVLAI